MNDYLTPLKPLLEDPQVTCVMVNDKDNIYVETEAGRIKTEARFEKEADLIHAMNGILAPLGRTLDAEHPSANVRLSDGTQVHMLMPPMTLTGATMILTKPTQNRLSWQDLMAFDVVDQRTLDFLQACVEARLNIVVAGGTNSGKTTLLNALIDFIPITERIITIESAGELVVNHPHAIRLEIPPPHVTDAIATCLNHAIQMCPDRIILANADGTNISPMLDAMRTGHDGSMFSLHATTPQDALERIEYFALKSGAPMPATNLRQVIASSIDIIVQQTRLPDGQRKIIAVAEVLGVQNDAITLESIMHQSDDGQTIWSKSPHCLKRIKPHLSDAFFSE